MAFSKETAKNKRSTEVLVSVSFVFKSNIHYLLERQSFYVSKLSTATLRFLSHCKKKGSGLSGILEMTFKRIILYYFT